MKKFCKKNIPVILLGNKADLEEQRQVSQDEAIQLALNEKIKFKEISCLKNQNVGDAFETLIELWNIENQKKLIVKKNQRRPSLDFIDNTNNNNSFMKNKTVNFRDDNLIKEITQEAIKLEKENHKKKKNKHCCK